MAPGKKRISNEPESGNLSDDSDFYGPESTVSAFEARAAQFSPSAWRRHKKPTLNELAASNIASAEACKSAVLCNPYAGATCGRQLDESIEDFLERLPPARTSASDHEWIYIANPFRKAPKFEDGDQERGDGDWARFVVLGNNLLEELTGLRKAIEYQKQGESKASITKAMNVEREKVVEKVLKTAKELGCTSGKWMLFCPAADVDAVWNVIARHTANNDLGRAAKVAPYKRDPREERLICIYTEDFTDLEDVTRVLKKLKALGLCEMKGKPLYYKCDAYTYLEIKSDNKWAIKASIYKSTELLDPDNKLFNEKNNKVNGHFYRRNDHGDYKKLENE